MARIRVTPITKQEIVESQTFHVLAQLEGSTVYLKHKPGFMSFWKNEPYSFDKQYLNEFVEVLTDLQKHINDSTGD